MGRINILPWHKSAAAFRTPNQLSGKIQLPEHRNEGVNDDITKMGQERRSLSLPCHRLPGKLVEHRKNHSGTIVAARVVQNIRPVHPCVAGSIPTKDTLVLVEPSASVCRAKRVGTWTIPHLLREQKVTNMSHFLRPDVEPTQTDATTKLQ
jgi:hypothetical protein